MCDDVELGDLISPEELDAARLEEIERLERDLADLDSLFTVTRAELAQSQDQVKQHHEEMADWEAQAERNAERYREAIDSRDAISRDLKAELAQVQGRLDGACDTLVNYQAANRYNERKAARYLRACKLIYRKWKWLATADWEDCYGVAPHDVKGTVGALRLELLERCEAMERASSQRCDVHDHGGNLRCSTHALIFGVRDLRLIDVCPRGWRELTRLQGDS